MPSLSAFPVMAVAQVKDLDDIVRTLEASLATLGYRHPQTDDHIHDMLALQSSLMSAITELVVVTMRVAGVILEREWRKNIMGKLKASHSCHATGQSIYNRGDKCH